VVDTTDVADPFVLPVPQPSGQSTTYYRFGTTDWQSNVPTATSTDLVVWHASPDAFPVLPSWAADSISMTWAPAVIAVGGRYLLYVTTEEASSGRQCISVATSPRPQGPYVDGSTRPFLCQRDLGGSIDPSVVRDAGGGLHLLWKNDGNCCGLATSLWEQDLSSDGLRLTGAAHVLLSAHATWQNGNVEGPAMIAAAGHGWWLFYSGGSWRTSDYATGLAFCPTIQGPCRDVLPRPYLPSTPNQLTPGGLETFRDRKGQMWVAFTTTVRIESRRRPGHYFLNRVLDIAPLLPG
jgi:beta-xylosidase